MANLTDLANSIILSGGDEVSEIADDSDAFIEMVNDVMVNIHSQVCQLVTKWTTSSGTFSAAGFELPIPADWDHVSDIQLYTDANMQSDFDSFDVEFGVIRFDSQQSAGLTYYFRYRLEPSVYYDLATEMPELANQRLKKIIKDEVTAIYLAADNDLESTNAEQSSLNKANRNS